MNDLITRDFFGAVDEMFNLPTRYNKGYLVGQIRVDVKEDNDKYTLLADLPGVPKEDVKLKFEDGSLTIAVSSEVNTEEKEGEKILRVERFSSMKRRTFYFGDNVKDAEIKAAYKDGVLTLTIPKHQPTVNVREIAIE